jgi:uncharacterized protein YndB with AHSA1/START domain
MTNRIDSASRVIFASPRTIYRAFAEPGAMEQWLPPSDMIGKMLHFDFREGGSYRMRLTYREPLQDTGKTSHDSDEVEVRLTKLEPDVRMEQEVVFESDDPAFAGIMPMIWTFQPDGDKTIVTVRAENVPAGISAQDHETGMNSSLHNLAAFVERPAI